MKRFNFPTIALACITFVVALGALSSRAEGRIYDLPIPSGPLQKTLAVESLKAVAEKSDDADLLLGIAYLAPAGDPLRQQISERVIKIKPEYAPSAAALAVMMDGADEANVARLIKVDPENALGYYMQANLLYEQRQEPKALDAFREAAKLREVRFYQSITTRALFKALDALKLQGRDRLYTLSWVATRMSNSYITQIQPLHKNLGELAVKADLAKREEISDILLVLAGHLYRTNVENRPFAERALQQAFRLKAEGAAAQESPRMYGYAAVTQALVSTMYTWPGITEGTKLQDVLPFVPGRIYRAFLIADPAATKKEEKLDMPAEAQAAYDKARHEEIDTANALIDAALKNPDEIVGAYLKGSIPPDKKERQPWVSSSTYVEKAMLRFPEVFKAAIRNEEAMNAVNNARSPDRRQQNLVRMMEITGSVLSYAFKHENQLPQRLDVLYEQKYLDRKVETKSLITGRPYVYTGANQKLPERDADRFQFIVLYDDEVVDGKQQATLAIPGGFEISADELKKRLEQQRK